MVTVSPPLRAHLGLVRVSALRLSYRVPPARDFPRTSWVRQACAIHADSFGVVVDYASQYSLHDRLGLCPAVGGGLPSSPMFYIVEAAVEKYIIPRISSSGRFLISISLPHPLFGFPLRSRNPLFASCCLLLSRSSLDCWHWPPLLRPSHSLPPMHPILDSNVNTPRFEDGDLAMDPSPVIVG
jgi:hypothetical protein